MKGLERSRERLKFHFDLERELAERLKSANAKERIKLYPNTYDELFNQVPEGVFEIIKDHELTFWVYPDNANRVPHFYSDPYLAAYLTFDKHCSFLTPK